MSVWKFTHDQSGWLAPEDVPLLTRIDDKNGVRNEQKLVRKGNLWWTPDGSMYVYYTPTHYKEAS